MKWFSCIGTACVLLILLAVPATATRFTGWEGNVTLDPETNITVGEHETWGDSALAALDTASKKGNFTYNTTYDEFGYFLIEVGGIENSSWIFLVNGEEAELGVGNYRCTDSDLITLYNSTWGEAPDYAPSPMNESDAVVNITAMISSSRVSSREGNDEIVWEEVALGPGTFTVTSENGTEYEVEERTALGALNASNATYVLDDMWYEQYGTLFISSINDREGEGLAGWVYRVNDETPEVGANVYAVEEGDVIVFYYSESMSAKPEDSAEAIYLKVVFENGTSGGYEGTVAA